MTLDPSSARPKSAVPGSGTTGAVTRRSCKPFTAAHFAAKKCDLLARRICGECADHELADAARDRDLIRVKWRSVRTQRDRVSRRHIDRIREAARPRKFGIIDPRLKQIASPIVSPAMLSVIVRSPF